MAKPAKPATAPEAASAKPTPKLKSTQPTVSVLNGALHKDHWIGGEATLRIAPDAQERNIKITLWNPYYNRAYLNNQVEVVLDGRNVFLEKLHPARAALIEYVLPAGEPLQIEIKSEARMEPDPLDTRERGVIVKLAQELLTA